MKFGKADIERFAEMYLDAEGNATEATRRIRELPGFREFGEQNLGRWLERGTHDFAAEIERAKERRVQRELEPVDYASRVIRTAEDRRKNLQTQYEEAVLTNQMPQASKLNSELMKLERHICELYTFVESLRHPREGEAAKRAVIVFVQMLIGQATAREREVITAVATKVLPVSSIGQTLRLSSG